jgi:SAM-dependent methyltransferase
MQVTARFDAGRGTAAVGSISSTPDMHALLDTIPCDICGSTSSRFLFKKKETRTWWIAKCNDDARLDRDFEFSIVECRGCKHVFVNPRLRQEVNSDIYARYWRSREPSRIAPNDYARYVCRQLAAIRPLGDLLDFGCGWGSVLREASRVGWRAVGVEVDARKVEFCREHGMEAVYGDVLDRPFAANSFDAAIAEQVFEHLYSPVDYMTELHRILRPGGVLYVAVPNFGSVAARLKRASWDLVHPVSHVRYFDRASLSTLLERCGFDVVPPSYERRFDGAPLKNLASKAKTFLERNLGCYPLGLALYARKRLE